MHELADQYRTQQQQQQPSSFKRGVSAEGEPSSVLQPTASAASPGVLQPFGTGQLNPQDPDPAVVGGSSGSSGGAHQPAPPTTRPAGPTGLRVEVGREEGLVRGSEADGPRRLLQRLRLQAEQEEEEVEEKEGRLGVARGGPPPPASETADTRVLGPGGMQVRAAPAMYLPSALCPVRLCPIPYTLYPAGLC